MRFAAAIALLLFTLSICSGSESGREGDFKGGLDPDLWIVRSSGNARVVVFRGCSPEHCFTRSYLQWLSEEWEEIEGTAYPVSRELRTVELEEAQFVGAFVQKVDWVPAEPHGYFVLEIANTYAEDPVVRLRVEVGEAGKYKAQRQSSASPAR